MKPDAANLTPATKSKSRMLKMALAVAFIVIVSVAFLVYWIFSGSQTSWLFKGAYATYKGSREVTHGYWNVTIRHDVVDFNNTHASLFTNVTLELMSSESSSPEIIGFQNVTVVDLRENSYEFKGGTFTSSYEEYVYCEGMGTRPCVIYEYSNLGAVDCVIILRYIRYYVDKQIGWPIKMGFSTMQHALDLNLTETNIRGLGK